jgi:hypothetical protein
MRCQVDPVVARAARRFAASLVESLEPRQLLAAVFDPGFGGGDGWIHFPLPFFSIGEHQLGQTSHGVTPSNLGEVDDRYLITVGHAETHPSGTGWLMRETIETLLEEDGSPAADYAQDPDGDGLAFYPWEGDEPDAVPTAHYEDSATLPDGRLLVSPAYLPGRQSGQAVAEIERDGSVDPGFVPEGIDGHRVEFVADGVAAAAWFAKIDPAGPFDPQNRALQVQLFDTTDGSLIGQPVRPFGTWLTGAQISGFTATRLHRGHDGRIYVAQPTTGGANPDIGLGMLLGRLEFDGEELVVDETFGVTTANRTTPSVYLERDPNELTLELAGATSDGRVWIRMPTPFIGGAYDTQAARFALLEANGEIDSDFGEAGFVDVRLADGSDFKLTLEFDGSPTFVGSRSFVRSDGALVGINSVDYRTGPDFVTDALVSAVFGLLPDGSFDERIAGADSAEGVGRMVLSTPVDVRDGDGSGLSLGAVTWMDRQQRLVMAHVYLTEVAEGEAQSYQDLVITRILPHGEEEQPSLQLVTRAGGVRVLEVTGTPADDRVTVRAVDGRLEVLSRVTDTVLGTFDFTEVDLVEVSGNAGDDDLVNEVGTAFSGFVTLLGGVGNDTLAGAGRYDRLFGGDGDDSLVGGDGDQLLFGGAGNDTLFGSGGRDALWGEAGNDVLGGSLGADLLDGGEGDDTLDGETGSDTLVAGDGADLLDGGEDATDLLWLRSTSSGGFVVDLSGGTASAGGPASTLAGLEHVLGSDGDDEIRGDDGRNLLLGAGGNDTLLGMGGKDTLAGGAGSDRLDGGDDWDLLLDLEALLGTPTAPDTLIGGGGFDLALVSDAEEDEAETERVFASLDDLLGVL